MKRLIVKGITVALLVAALAFPLASPAFADTSPNGPGQPGAPGTTCFTSDATAMAPGGSSTAPGSVFNASSGEAGEVYAGNPGTPSLANGSSTAVSQYDIACLQVTPP